MAKSNLLWIIILPIVVVIIVIITIILVVIATGGNGLNQYCSTQSQCGRGYICENNICKAGANSSCEVDVNCAGGLACISNRCVTKPPTGTNIITPSSGMFGTSGMSGISGINSFTTLGTGALTSGINTLLVAPKLSNGMDLSSRLDTLSSMDDNSMSYNGLTSDIRSLVNRLDTSNLQGDRLGLVNDRLGDINGLLGQNLGDNNLLNNGLAANLFDIDNLMNEGPSLNLSGHFKSESKFSMNGNELTSQEPISVKASKILNRMRKDKPHIINSPESSDDDSNFVNFEVPDTGSSSKKKSRSRRTRK